MSAELSFVLSQFTHVMDRQTDAFAIGKTALHTVQHDKQHFITQCEGHFDISKCIGVTRECDGPTDGRTDRHSNDYNVYIISKATFHFIVTVRPKIVIFLSLFCVHTHTHTHMRLMMIIKLHGSWCAGVICVCEERCYAHICLFT